MAVVKPEIGVVLADEAKVWAERLEKYRYEGNLLMAEQALGRQLEAEWLLGVFTGKIKYAPAKNKANSNSASAKAAKPAAKKAAAAKKPAAKKPAAKKPAAKKAAPKMAAKAAPKNTAKTAAKASAKPATVASPVS